MPKKLEETEGDPDKLVPIQLMVPRWYKNACIRKAKDAGLGLTHWGRAWMDVGLGADGPPGKKATSGTRKARTPPSRQG